jgi:hypothetical protein
MTDKASRHFSVSTNILMKRVDIIMDQASLLAIRHSNYIS